MSGAGSPDLEVDGSGLRVAVVAGAGGSNNGRGSPRAIAAAGTSSPVKAGR